MAERSVREAFDELLARSVPLSSERNAAASHRASVEAALRDKLSVRSIRETGSFHHGTGVRGHSDVDILVSIARKPESSDTALQWVREALTSRFRYTPIRISRPAVVVDFADGRERWEVIPGFYRGTTDGFDVYDIPAPAGGWIQTAPSAHLRFVNDANLSPKGGAKALARLLKRWKYENLSGFPASSFYLEMRAASYMNAETYFLADMDFERIMRRLASSELAAMNDPMNVTGRIAATSSPSNQTSATSRIRADADRTQKALEAENGGDRARAFTLLDDVFLGSFPSRFYTP
ncbi:SMODS domain-containing nucleotidyltransferase [Promicromonospora sp. CA-289599]|uniref:SMODS domain-containing nucleotidyltransferase n=1 Tax=Promicromonospora sp. CA-289599 TaxID=3240014 RepID=UPI003D92DDD1